jgi:hypothetical protein
MSDLYDNVPGGSLKLKGGSGIPNKIKKYFVLYTFCSLDLSILTNNFYFVLEKRKKRKKIKKNLNRTLKI